MAGDEFYVDGLGGPNGFVTPSVLAFDTVAVPEPASLVLFGLGALSLCVAARRRRGA